MPRGENSGGKNPGAGRPKGSKNVATRIREAKASKGGLMPVDFLLQVMRNSNRPLPIRIDAAKSVAPYLHPRLAQVSTENKTDMNIIHHGGLPDLPVPEDDPSMDDKDKKDDDKI